MSPDLINKTKIPPLIPTPHDDGDLGTLIHCFPFGHLDYCRMEQESELVIRVKLQISDIDCIKAAHLLCMTDLKKGKGETWSQSEFLYKGDSYFEYRVQLEKPGTFRFRIKYSLDDGQTWRRDRLSFFTVIVEPRGFKQVKLYSLIPRISGSFSDWIELLPHIKSMGFNTIHLLPITFMDKSKSPYAAYDLFSPDPDYGNPGDNRPLLVQFEEFVQKARESGIKLCFDLVLNHVGVTSQIAKTCPDWIVPDEKEDDGFLRAGAMHGQEWVQWRDLGLLNYDNPDKEQRRSLWAYMSQYVHFWSFYAHYTGGMVRLDNLHSSNEKFLVSVLESTREKYPNLSVFAELFTEHKNLERLMKKYALHFLLATPWGAKFAPYLRNYITYIHSIKNKVKYIFPISTHDSGSPAEEYGSIQSTIPRYVISMLYTTGHTGIVQGCEYCLEKKVEFIGHQEPLLEGHTPRLAPFFRMINNLASTYPHFSNHSDLIFIDQDHDSILGALRPGRPEDGCDFLLLANLDIHNYQTLIVKGKMPYSEVEAIDMAHNKRKVHLPRFGLNITMEPCGIRIFKLPHPNRVEKSLLPIC